MERLTEKAVGCFEYALKDHKAVPGEFGTYDAFFDYSMAVKRLGRYEELMERWKLRSIEEADRIFQRINDLGGTDLMAQYRKLGPIEHLRELIRAEQDGRLVVLPCKDWLDIVFGEQVLFWGIDDGYIENPIREISVDNSDRITWYNGWKTVVLKGTDENGETVEFYPEEVGKTVFLTREEAETALAQKGGEG